MVAYKTRLFQGGGRENMVGSRSQWSAPWAPMFIAAIPLQMFYIQQLLTTRLLTSRKTLFLTDTLKSRTVSKSLRCIPFSPAGWGWIAGRVKTTSVSESGRHMFSQAVDRVA